MLVDRSRPRRGNQETEAAIGTGCGREAIYLRLRQVGNTVEQSLGELSVANF